MKTEDLIHVLAADAARPTIPIGRYLAVGLLVGTLLAIALFGATLHPRADLSEAFRSSPGFVYKLIIAFSLAATAGGLLPQVARPMPVSQGRRTLLVVAPVLLAIGVGVELYIQPEGLWLPRLVGHNAAHCLALIPLLSAAPGVCLFLALRQGAAAQPVFAGAVAGLIAGGVGALLYALTCPDDSPLFVATWYTIAIAVVTSVTAYAGSRFLRW
jgi:hypothetical protein